MSLSLDGFIFSTNLFYAPYCSEPATTLKATMVCILSLPVYRQPTWIETFIADSIEHFQPEFGQLSNTNRLLSHCLKLPAYNYITTFTCIIGVSIFWIVYLYFSSWKTERAAAVQKALQGFPKATATLSPSGRAIDAGNKDDPTPEIPVHPHSSTHRNMSNSSPSTIGDHFPFGIGESSNGRTGRVSTPGYQTPFVSSSGQRCYSHLKGIAPVTYATLRQDGVLEEDGTPTRKLIAAVYEDKIDTKKVYNSPTRSWRDRKDMPEKVVEASWMTDEDDARVQHFSPPKWTGKTF